MIIFAEMFFKAKNKKNTETQYDGFVFAVEILITLLLLAFMYYLVN